MNYTELLNLSNKQQSKIAEIKKELLNSRALGGNVIYITKGELAIRDLEQQAKGLEDYVSKTMDNCYMLHLDPEEPYQAFLINLNATALRLRNQAKALKGQSHG